MKGLRLILWILVAAVILLLVNAPFSGAAAKTLFKKKANTPSIAPAGGEKPDLELKPLKWSKTPRQGDTVGRTSILNIIVVNKGKAASRNCKIQIRCTSLSGGNSPSSINGVLALSALNPGKSISLSWPSMSAEIWPAGTFKISAQADSQNIVKESNETNNKKYLSFTVQPKIQLKPPKKVGKEQLQPPKKAGRQQLKPAIKPSIQRAGSQIKDNLALIDYDILSVKSDPTQPHTQEYVTVSVKIHNKTPAYAGTPFYFKCKPLDGNICPGGQPGQEMIVHRDDVKLNANETRDIKMFHQGNDWFQAGRYLLAAAKDKDFKKSLVFTVMTVQAPEDVPVRIRKLTVYGIEIPPSGELVQITTRPEPMGFEIYGGGFNQQSKVYYQNTKTGGNIWAVDAPEISAERIRGHLPVSASNTAGSYLLWIKNANGDQTATYRFNLVEPGSSPQIYEWSPKTITEWQHWTDVGNGRWAAYVTFHGKNLTKAFSDHWVESNTVSDDLYLTVYKGRGFYRILFTTGTDFPPQDGEIKLWIYNKHRDPSIDTKGNAQWFIIKVRNVPVRIDPPTITKPEEQQVIALKDVAVTLKDPATVRVIDYELEWQKKAGNFFMPVAILDEIHKSVADKAGTQIIPIEKFDHEGVYRFRARVKRSTRLVVKPDPQWSDWRQFKVLRKLTIDN